MSQPAPMSCIQVPMLDTSVAIQSIRNTGRRSDGMPSQRSSRLECRPPRITCVCESFRPGMTVRFSRLITVASASASCVISSSPRLEQAVFDRPGRCPWRGPVEGCKLAVHHDCPCHVDASLLCGFAVRASKAQSRRRQQLGSSSLLDEASPSWVNCPVRFALNRSPL